MPIYRGIVRPWRESKPIAAMVIVVFLAIQLLVPIIQRGDDGEAARFGWQMFSGSDAPPEFQIETTDGVDDVKLADYLLRERVELDLVMALPPHLCSIVPNAVAITWEEGRFEC